MFFHKNPFSKEFSYRLNCEQLVLRMLYQHPTQDERYQIASGLVPSCDLLPATWTSQN
ncbi:hypothetical protein XCCB100_1777 [Xanthomonas campestris pv. campestris]|uniref:Uncharacterized protein n=1 Tax=Xanthomonas campestris pv. campestris (strain B100) TaxID=509169 RepID=B0RRP4_XANCB|nr:hypothetical protein XCCB100_1777 [Xanthomonas campestris pv. campestris]